MKAVFFSSTEWFANDQLGQFAPWDCVVVRGGLDDLARLAMVQRPDALFVGEYENLDKLTDAITKILADVPEMFVMTVCSVPRPESLIQLMRAGVREVLPSADSQAIKDCLIRVQSRLMLSATGKSKVGRLVGFLSAKGGDGGSFVAANFAWALAQMNPLQKVLIMDLSLPFGDIEMYLTSKHPDHDLSNYATEIDRLDNALFESMTGHLTDNLSMIVSPRSFEKVVLIQAKHVERVFEIARKNYDFVFVDLGTGLDPIGLQTLEKLDFLYLVSTLTMPSTRRTSQILRLWEGLGYEMDKVQVIVNKNSPRQTVKLSDFEAALNKKAERILSADSEGVQESLVKGKPLVEEDPKSALSKQIKDWVDHFSGKVSEDRSLWHRLKIK